MNVRDLIETDELGFACFAAREEIRRQIRQARARVAVWTPVWAREARRG